MGGVTKDFWKSECLTSSSDLYYLFHAPNGDKYYFDVEDGSHADLDYNGYPIRQELGQGSLFASKVEDKNGNWVKYEYRFNSNNEVVGVKRIYSNDGREINIQYNSSNRVTKVIANNRTWTYTYSGSKLYRIYLPDGKYWEYTFSPYTKVKHPYGAKITYQIAQIINGFIKSVCDYNSATITKFGSNAVTSKTLEVGSSTSVWNFVYEQDNGTCTGGLLPTKNELLRLRTGLKRPYSLIGHMRR